MTALTAPTKGSYTLYRDKKLATWAIYEPRLNLTDAGIPGVGVYPPGVWVATGDGYGKNVTVLGLTRDSVLKKIEAYSEKNSRSVSPTEADTVFTYGVFGLIAGGAATAVGLIGKFPKITAIGGTLATLGLGGAVAGKLIAPRGERGQETLVLDVPPGS